MNANEQSPVRYRPFRVGDGPGIITCLRDEYGDTYPRICYYGENYFARESAVGALRLFIADYRGEVIGFLITRRSDLFRGQTELSTMVICKRYRGLGLSAPFLEYAVRELRSERDHVLFGHTQMFHAISQENLYGLGLVPCGLLLSVLLAAPLRHSFHTGRGPKLSLGVMVHAPPRRNAGTLHIPRELCRYTTLLYNGMAAQYRLCHDEHTAAAGELRVVESFGQSTALVVVDAFSRNDADILAAKLRQWRGDPLHTVNVLLNCSHPSAVAGYRALAATGFFFTGFQPACAGGEYMLLHHPMAVPAAFGDMIVSDAFAGIVKYIKDRYREGGWEHA